MNQNYFVIFANVLQAEFWVPYWVDSMYIMHWIHIKCKNYIKPFATKYFMPKGCFFFTFHETFMLPLRTYRFSVYGSLAGTFPTVKCDLIG